MERTRGRGVLNPARDQGLRKLSRILRDVRRELRRWPVAASVLTRRRVVLEATRCSIIRGVMRRDREVNALDLAVSARVASRPLVADWTRWP